MTDHNPLPVHGYQPQSDKDVHMVNINKITEEKLLRMLDEMRDAGHQYDQRWLSVARTHFEQGYMALNRAIFQPKRFKLPGEDITS